MRSAVTLVTERGTAAVPISDIAEAADVSRQVLYQQFGDRDCLLLEAALDLMRRELLPRLADDPQVLPGRARSLAVARHYADHRVFYRALMTGSTAFALDKAQKRLVVPFNRQVIQQMCGGQLDARMVEDLATFLTGGGGAFVTAWVVEGEDPLDPEEFADRLMRMVAVLADALLQPTTTTHDREQAR